MVWFSVVYLEMHVHTFIFIWHQSRKKRRNSIHSHSVRLYSLRSMCVYAIYLYIMRKISNYNWICKICYYSFCYFLVYMNGYLRLNCWCIYVHVSSFLCIWWNLVSFLLFIFFVYFTYERLLLITSKSA